MHPNPVYHTHSHDQNVVFARKRAFGVLAVNATVGPLVSHVPFLLEPDGTTLWLHLVRSNPIARMMKEPLNCRIAVSGPDSYVSPDWYDFPEQVPTWNYIAVHLTGQIERRPQEELLDLLDRQSAHFEQQLLPKTPWTTGKMTPEVLKKMMRMIVPCRKNVTGIDGTWKMNQNKPDEVRLRAADGVAAHGLGSEMDALSALMRDLDGQS